MVERMNTLSYATPVVRPPPPSWVWWLAVLMTAAPLIGGVGSTTLFALTRAEFFIMTAFMSLASWGVVGLPGLIIGGVYGQLAKGAPANSHNSWLPFLLWLITIPAAFLCFMIGMSIV